MSLIKKIFLASGSYAAFAFVSNHYLDPSRQMTSLELIFHVAAFTIAIISFLILKREPNRKNKYIFLNFAIFFSLASLPPLSRLVVENLIAVNPFIGFYIYQYTNSSLFFFLAVSIGYVVIDSLFRDFKTIQKYLLTFLVVGIFFWYYFSPLFLNPKYLYETAEVQDFTLVSRTISQLSKDGIVNPSPEEVASLLTLPAWNEGKQIGTLFAEANVERIRELYPYLQGNNYILLVYRPLFLGVTYMSVFCVIFIFLFFGYQYRKDPPQGAYIEKIIFLFLPYCSLEILHNYGYVQSI